MAAAGRGTLDRALSVIRLLRGTWMKWKLKQSNQSLNLIILRARSSNALDFSVL